MARMVVAWLLTLPAAGAVGAVCFGIADMLPAGVGVPVVFAILIALAALMWLQSRRHPIDTTNLIEDWDGGRTPPRRRRRRPRPPLGMGKKG